MEIRCYKIKLELECLQLRERGLDGVVVEFLPTTPEAAGSNFGLGTAGKLMAGGLQCSMHWFPPPIELPLASDPGC